MIVKELKEILNKYSEDDVVVITYDHSVFGPSDFDPGKIRIHKKTDGKNKSVVKISVGEMR